MLLIDCPHCGPRDEVEFHYGGQAHVAYPADPDQLTDREWAEYLFYRDNPEGTFAERWVHAGGCRRWFNAVRDTRTYEFTAVYPVNEAQPDDAAGQPAGEHDDAAGRPAATAQPDTAQPDTTQGGHR